MFKKNKPPVHLSDEDILIISKPLARAVGIAQSVILRRIYFWCHYNEQDSRDKKSTHFRENRWWMYNTNQEWEDDIEIYSQDHIQRTLNDLKRLGLVLFSQKFNRLPIDRTMWYTINVERYQQFLTMWQDAGSPSCLLQSKKSKEEYSDFIALWFAFLKTENSSHSDQTATCIPTKQRHESTVVTDSVVESLDDLESEDNKKPSASAKKTPAEDDSNLTVDPVRVEGLQTEKLGAANKSPIGFVSKHSFATEDDLKTKKKKIKSSLVRRVESSSSYLKADKANELDQEIVVMQERKDFKSAKKGRQTETYPSPNALFDSSELFRKFVDERIDAAKAFYPMNPHARANMIVKEICNYGEAYGWLLYLERDTHSKDLEVNPEDEHQRYSLDWLGSDEHLASLD